MSITLTVSSINEVGAATTARPAPKKYRRQAESILPHACCAFSATTGATASPPESGALSHSRAGFAEESATGAYLRT